MNTHRKPGRTRHWPLIGRHRHRRGDDYHPMVTVGPIYRRPPSPLVPILAIFIPLVLVCGWIGGRILGAW